MFEVLDEEHPDFGVATEFVRENFKRTYGANVHSFMPNFIRVSDRNGHTKAVVGFRDAASGPLYLEQYMDQPIEAAISRYMAMPVQRSEIVEVGNMSEAAPGDARMAIIGATACLYNAGYRWVVFTGISRLRNAFRRLGLNPKELMEADETLLSREERESWGSYYAGGAVICFGEIKEGHDNLQELWTALRDTWAAAEIAGQKLAEEKRAL